MPPHIVRYPPIQCNTRERCDQLQIPAPPPAWRVPEGPDNLAAAPMGGGRAWPGFEGKLHHTQRHKRRRCGGRRRVRRARLRHPWAAAGPGRASRGSSTTHSDTSDASVEGAEGSGGPGRASRSTTPSRRLVCGDLAGGRARRRQNTSGATSNKTARPGRRRARLRSPWAAAGPGRASRRRAERSSQRGRLAGGPPPTGTPSSPATRPGPTAPRTPAVPQATKQQGQGVGGPGCGTHGRRQGLAGLRGEAPPHTATQAPPVRRAPEGPEGQGGLRDRPLRAKGSCVAISRAAGPDGAQNTSGATSNTAHQTRLVWRLPEGTPSSPATRPDPTAPGTSAAPQATRARHAETPPRR